MQRKMFTVKICLWCVIVKPKPYTYTHVYCMYEKKGRHSKHTIYQVPLYAMYELVWYVKIFIHAQTATLSCFPRIVLLPFDKQNSII